MATTRSSRGILAEGARAHRERIVDMFTGAYWMEIETVMSYIANSTTPERGRAPRNIVASLREDIQQELGHATQFANLIKELYGIVPGIRLTSRPYSPTCSRPNARPRSCR